MSLTNRLRKDPQTENMRIKMTKNLINSIRRITLSNMLQSNMMLGLDSIQDAKTDLSNIVGLNMFLNINTSILRVSLSTNLLNRILNGLNRHKLPDPRNSFNGILVLDQLTANNIKATNNGKARRNGHANGYGNLLDGNRLRHSILLP